MLEQKLAQAKADGVETRALVVINPGNPTGNTLSEANMKEIVHFCDKHGLVLMADEVYQENVYEQALPFLSFKKVVKWSADSVQLVSFHSTSKGFLEAVGCAVACTKAPPSRSRCASAAAQARLHWPVLQHARPDRDWADGAASRGGGCVVRELPGREGRHPLEHEASGAHARRWTQLA